MEDAHAISYAAQFMFSYWWIRVVHWLLFFRAASLASDNLNNCHDASDATMREVGKMDQYLPITKHNNRGPYAYFMMTSPNGNIFRVTVPLGGEFTGHRWIPLTKRPVTRSFDIFFDLCLKKRLSKNRYAGDFRRHRAHYDANIMLLD